MIEQNYTDIVTPELSEGAIINDEFTGFREDYLVLHCLLKNFQPKTVWELGCNMGTGTNIICNAVPVAKVYSFDLPTELAHISLQHPISEGKGDRVGERCKLPFELIRGDSMAFDFSQYKCEAAFIDGEHDFQHACHETKAMLKNKTKLIIYHDSNIPEVLAGITQGISESKAKGYEFYRVTGTRIAYLIKNK